MSRRFVVDGTEAEDNFTLSGDGETAPFAVFDIERQDWLKGFHKHRIVAHFRALWNDFIH